MRTWRIFYLAGLIWWLGGGLATAGGWIEPPSVTSAGFPVPTPDKIPVLPAAHGAHPEYAIEWWYWIGHLNGEGTGDRYGFQATVFRLAGQAGAQSDDSGEGLFGKDQLYLAHVALVDVRAGVYHHAERMVREGWQAGAKEGSLELRAGPIEAVENGDGFRLNFDLPGGQALDLELVPEKPMVVFGERGLSRKGAAPEAVSWYWTYTRLAASGTLRTSEGKRPVSGLAWMDHEISSSQLGEDLEGWDWTCMQLNDGTEVKAYRLRRAGGGMDPWSAVYWIDQEGGTQVVDAWDFEWIERAVWSSKETGNGYPIEVEVQARHPDGSTRRYLLKPLLAGQEFVGNDGGNAYWEGACDVFDERGERIGTGYLELAGYGGGLAARLNRNGND
ncbi:MAG: lipocalin-like domain-containing protein [Puniceicoccaceae bacterium]